MAKVLINVVTNFFVGLILIYYDFDVFEVILFSFRFSSSIFNAKKCILLLIESHTQTFNIY